MIAYEPVAEDEQVTGRQSLLSRGERFQLPPILCGGSRDGWCEVFPGKKRCIYVRAYRRLRAYREEESMKDGYILPRNWDLAGTSSWANYFLGRDHQGIKQ